MLAIVSRRGRELWSGLEGSAREALRRIALPAARRRARSWGFSFPLSAELLWRGDMSTVVGMGSTEKVKARDLVVGGRYLHRNGLFIRQIDEIEGDRVHYHEPHGDWSWSCGKSAFIRACPTLATAEDEARAEEELRELTRLEKGLSRGAPTRRTWRS